MSTCQSCGTTIIEEASYCSHCGKPLTRTPVAPTPRLKWYYNVWFVLFMLFFVVGPLGLPLVWKNPRFASWVKIVLTIIMALYTVVLIDVTIRASRAVMEQVNQFNSTLGF